jgi:hypothetical protein
MSERLVSIKKAIPIIAMTWVLSLITTLAIAYFTPFAPIGADKIADSAVTTNKISDAAIITIKLADGSITSAKIENGTITYTDLATGAVRTANIQDYSITGNKLANSSVTNPVLAPYAIPFDATANMVEFQTSSTTWTEVGPIPNLWVDVNCPRRCCLLILFSTEAKSSSPTTVIHLRALYGSSTASPDDISFFPGQNYNVYNAYSYNFWWWPVDPGSYRVKMQWQISGGGTGYLRSPTLIVIALPM